MTVEETPLPLAPVLAETIEAAKVEMAKRETKSLPAERFIRSAQFAGGNVEVFVKGNGLSLRYYAKYECLGVKGCTEEISGISNNSEAHALGDGLVHVASIFGRQLEEAINLTNERNRELQAAKKELETARQSFTTADDCFLNARDRANKLADEVATLTAQIEAQATRAARAEDDLKREQTAHAVTIAATIERSKFTERALQKLNEHFNESGELMEIRSLLSPPQGRDEKDWTAKIKEFQATGRTPSSGQPNIPNEPDESIEVAP